MAAETQDTQNPNFVVKEGVHYAEAPFKTKKWNVKGEDECCACCNSRNIELTESELIYEKKGCCGERTEKRHFKNLGGMVEKKSCCEYGIKFEFEKKTIRGSDLVPENPCCINAGEVRKLYTEIEMRVKWHMDQKAEAPASPIVNVTVNAPQPQMMPQPVYVQQQPQMVMVQQPQVMMVQQPQVMMQQPMVMQQQPVAMAPVGVQVS